MYSLVPNSLPVDPVYADIQDSIQVPIYNKPQVNRLLLLQHNNMHHGDRSFIPRANTSIIMAKQYGLREDPCCSPTPTGIITVNLTLRFYPGLSFG